jgi:2-C-methyl-D-erythritol 4-phosphate cytidylyltransferase
MRVFVILPAAGMGTRMAAGSHAAAPKQFLSVGGVPVLVRSVKAFLDVARIDAVCVAVRASERDRVEDQIREYKLGPRVHMVEGGDHRQESVSNALAALECDDEDVVLVHDAVRPLIDVGTIERTIDAVMRHGAAIVGLPAVDTIKQVDRTADGAIITATIPRELIVLAQTPQGSLRPRLMDLRERMRRACWSGLASRWRWLRDRRRTSRLRSLVTSSLRSSIWNRQPWQVCDEYEDWVRIRFARVQAGGSADYRRTAYRAS